ncbi:hypothetical protein ACFVDI_14195 [Nocardioides sp. NPDC057767]|uniref:hypothetical protein n=1 Tax=unclassified Nocardioides TaxID=2615069 RepID=UPI0036716914
MTSARATRSAVPYLPETIAADIHDLDERVVCDRCGEPYLIIGSGRQRRLQPNHRPTCTFYRAPKLQNAPVSPDQAPRDPEAQDAQPGPHRPGYIRPENRRCKPSRSTTTPPVDIDLARLSDPGYLRAVTRDLFGPRTPEPGP